MLNDLTDRINLLFVWSGPDVLKADVEMSADANLSLNHNLAAGFFPPSLCSPPTLLIFFFFKVPSPFSAHKKVSVMITINWKGPHVPSLGLWRAAFPLRSREATVKSGETPQGVMHGGLCPILIPSAHISLCRLGFFSKTWSKRNGWDSFRSGSLTDPHGLV